MLLKLVFFDAKNLNFMISRTFKFILQSFDTLQSFEFQKVYLFSDNN